MYGLRILRQFNVIPLVLRFLLVGQRFGTITYMNLKKKLSLPLFLHKSKTKLLASEDEVAFSDRANCIWFWYYLLRASLRYEYLNMDVYLSLCFYVYIFCMYMYVYIGCMHLYIHLVMCVCIYTYIYIYYTISFLLVVLGDKVTWTFFKFTARLDVCKLGTWYFKISLFS